MILDPVEKFKRDNPEKYLLAPEYWGISDELLYSSSIYTFALKLLKLKVPDHAVRIGKLMRKYGNLQDFDNLDGAYQLSRLYYPNLEKKILDRPTFWGMKVFRAPKADYGLLLTPPSYQGALRNVITFNEYSQIKKYKNVLDYLKNFPPFQRDREILRCIREVTPEWTQ